MFIGSIYVLFSLPSQSLFQWTIYLIKKFILQGQTDAVYKKNLPNCWIIHRDSAPERNIL